MKQLNELQQQMNETNTDNENGTFQEVEEENQRLYAQIDQLVYMNHYIQIREREQSEKLELAKRKIEQLETKKKELENLELLSSLNVSFIREDLENISYDEIPPAPSDLDSEIEKNLEDNEVLSLSKQEALREKELLVEKLKNLQKNS